MYTFLKLETLIEHLYTETFESGTNGVKNGEDLNS